MQKEPNNNNSENVDKVDQSQIPDSIPEMKQTLIETVGGMWQSFLEHLPLLLIGLIILFATSIVSKIANKIVSKIFETSNIRVSLKELFTRLISVGIWVLGLLLVAMVIFPGLTPAKALGALGVLSVAIGFAFKDIFENFLAGILILLRFPFENGDYVEVEGITGEVIDTSIRMTTIRKTNDELVTVPNSIIFKNPVRILTSKNKRRIEIITGVGYDEDVKKSCAVIEKALKNCKTVSTDHDIQVFPHAFGSSSIDIEVAWWADPTPLGYRKSRGEVITEIKKALDKAEIEIPFPYRTLTFKENLKFEKVEDKKESN